MKGMYRVYYGRNHTTMDHLLPTRKDTICTMDWSPDNTRLVVGRMDSTIQIIDPSNMVKHKSQLTPMTHDSGVRCVAWSPDGRRIVSMCHWSIRIWDARTGEKLYESKQYEYGFLSVSWSPDSRYIVSGSQDRVVRVWDLDSSRVCMVQSMPGHTSSVYSVAWSPTGGHIVSGSGDSTVRLWVRKQNTDGSYLDNKSCLFHTKHHILSHHDDKVTSVCWSPCGSMFASGSWDNSVYVLDKNGTILKRIVDHDDFIASIDWCSNGNEIAMVSVDGVCRILDLEHGKVKYTIPYNTTNNTLRSSCYIDNRVKCSHDYKKLTFSDNGGVVCHPLRILLSACL